MYHDAFLGKLILQGNSLNSTLGLDWKRKRENGEGRGKVEGGGWEGEGGVWQIKPKAKLSRLSDCCVGGRNLSDNHPGEVTPRTLTDGPTPRDRPARSEHLKKNGPHRE